jgi:hypothetical protein
VARIGLEVREGVAPGDHREALRDPEALQEPDRVALVLVGADGEPESGRREPVEGLDGAREELGVDAQVVAVMDHEGLVQLVEPRRRDLATGGREPALEERAGARAHHRAARLQGQGRQALAGEDHVQGGDEVVDGIGERTVEVKNGDRRTVRRHHGLAFG